MDQPEQKQTIPAPSQWGWWSSDLGDYRPLFPDPFRTYCNFSYDDLPPITGIPFTGDFQWLTPLDSVLAQRLARSKEEVYDPTGHLLSEARITDYERVEMARHAKAIGEQARQLGLTLPPGFLRFITSIELQSRIPSPTACTFSLPERIVPYPGRENGYVLSFLWDTQACGIWHLYLTTDGAHRVLEAPFEFVELTANAEQCSEATLDDILAHVYLCAPMFEEFLYRFWLENMIWYHLNGYNTAGTRIGPKPLTEAQQRYLAHYATK